MHSATPATRHAIKRLTPTDSVLFDQMLDLFAHAFDDPESYATARPSQSYRQKLLSRRENVALVATQQTQVIGALFAYELQKFEQERSEFYIYDLAVAPAWRRRGVATSLIRALGRIAKDAGGWVIFVQADHGDNPAIALYTKLGAREDVLHFDIGPD